MIKTPISLQDLRRRIYLKAKSQPAWRFWGLYVHICKEETLREAYAMAKINNGAPGIDGVSFEAIEATGVDSFIAQIRRELQEQTYLPIRNRRVEIPKANGKIRALSIPTIRDRVVQGAIKLILEPIFEAQFQEGSIGFRPRRSQAQAINRVAEAIVRQKTHIIDADLKSYFDNIRHDILMGKMAKRVNDDDVMRLLRLTFKNTGKRGIPQGSPLSPLMANIYLNEMDIALESLKEKTRNGKYTYLEYARFADDLVILIDGKPWREKLLKTAFAELKNQLKLLDIQLNEDKTKVLDLTQKGQSLNFLGFALRRSKTLKAKWGVRITPSQKARKQHLAELRAVFRRYVSQPLERVIEEINPIHRGWVNYFRIGHSAKCFRYVQHWLEMRMFKHESRARSRRLNWDQWKREQKYRNLEVYNDYKIRYYSPQPMFRFE